jgi:flagellar assembly protein FliH
MVAPGDCAIEWADGGAERNGDRVWTEIDAAVRRMTEKLPDSAPSSDAAGLEPADGE